MKTIPMNPLLCLLLIQAQSCAESSAPGDTSLDGQGDPAPDHEGDEADAGQESDSGEPACTDGERMCSGVCVDTESSHDHCGDCLVSCRPEQVCFGGDCLLECPAGSSPCGGTCVDTETDTTNCGSCGNACPTGPNATARCSDGSCRLACNDGWADLDGAPGCECRISNEECNGRDDDCDGEADNDAPCPDDYRCIDGSCELYCDPPNTQPVSGDCLPSCGTAGGNWCPPGMCLIGQDPVQNNCCPPESIIDTWDCREGDSRPDNNYCCTV